MNPTEVFAALYRLSSPLVFHYRTDLDIDRKFITEHDTGTPFLHWTRESGTDLVFLQPAETYPPRDTEIPYLFGSAGRQHILDGVVKHAEYWVERDPQRLKLTLYFDGERLKIIDGKRAIDLAKEYRARIEAVWKKERQRFSHREFPSPLRVGVAKVNV